MNNKTLGTDIEVQPEDQKSKTAKPLGAILLCQDSDKQRGDHVSMNLQIET